MQPIEEAFFSVYRQEEEKGFGGGGGFGGGDSQVETQHQQRSPEVSGPRFLHACTAEAAPLDGGGGMHRRPTIGCDSEGSDNSSSSASGSLRLVQGGQGEASSSATTLSRDSSQSRCGGARQGDSFSRGPPDSGSATFRNFALFDREEEARRLKRALDRGCCGSELAAGAPAGPSSPAYPHRAGGKGGELVLVTGPSGCGKTCLVESVVGRSAPSADSDTDGRRWVLICGKFDQLERREQYYAIIQALTEYALILSRESSPSQLQSVRAALAPHRETVRIVADLVPELLPLLSEDSLCETSHNQERPQQHGAPSGTRLPGATHSSPEGGAVARERLQLGVRRFFSAVCCPKRPAVLFLDDLQWAEPASLDLVASLITPHIPGLVVVGACRDNEVDPASYLCAILRELEARSVAITQVVVSNVGQPALGAALGGSLFRFRSDKASTLARILYEHTSGNMFFVTQLVRYLVSEGVLYKPEKETRRWTFDSERRVRDAIRDAKDEVSLLAVVIQRQSREVQDALMVASCLGAEFSELVLRAATGGAYDDATESLQMAERMALLKRASHDRGTWRFVHDRIQESAYSLIPIHEREEVHLRIGRNLWSALSEDELDEHAHVVVKQLRLGVRLIVDPAERELLATLLLRAGEMAAKASAHVTAQEYVALGIQLLETRHWRDQYSLSLALYNAAAEIEYCLANFERMDGLVEVIMENARSTKDKIRAQTARIYALGSRNELDEAIDVGLATLKDFFGERLPSRPSVVSILSELRRTKRLLRGHSDESLLSLPTLNDCQTYASLRIMSLLMVYVVLCRPELAPILAMRIVQHSLRYGLCSMSSTGFACYGMVLASFFNDVETGIRYGRVALRIIERFDAMDQLARASTVTYCFCLAHTDPLPTLLQPLRLAHRAGLGSGDIEHSLLAAGMYTVAAVYSYRPLADVSSEVSSFMALASAYRHSGTELMFRPMAQLVECLRGEAPDPSKLNGSYLEWEPSLQLAKATNHPAAESMILTSKLIVEYIFRNFNDAETSANDLAVVVSGPDGRACYMKATSWLFQGLALLAQSHKDGIFVRPRVRRARQYHRQLVRLSKFSELNYGGKALLLGAELLVVCGSYHQGLLQYEAAVAAARRAEAWGDAALASERLSSALQAKGRSDESLLYLNQAAKYYELWGATAKVAELQSRILLKAAGGSVVLK